MKVRGARQSFRESHAKTDVKYRQKKQENEWANIRLKLNPKDETSWNYVVCTWHEKNR